MKTDGQMYVTEKSHTMLKVEAEKRGGTKIAFIINEWCDQFLKDGNPTSDELHEIEFDVASRGKNRSKTIRTTAEINEKIKKIALKTNKDMSLNMVKVLSLIVNRYA